VVGNIPSIDPAEVRIGMPVEAYWDEREDVLLPQWRPA